jgi:hypothetical protein
MNSSTADTPSDRLLRCGIVIRADEHACLINGEGAPRSVSYATVFPSPRTERVSPGHLVAVATSPSGLEAIIWRWYDAVILGQETETDALRLWEPAHGEVLAKQRQVRGHRPGTRAYLSAGLPGADWWVAGAVVAKAGDAEVELDEVERLYNEHDLWNTLA